MMIFYIYKNLVKWSWFIHLKGKGFLFRKIYYKHFQGETNYGYKF